MKKRILTTLLALGCTLPLFVACDAGNVTSSNQILPGCSSEVQDETLSFQARALSAEEYTLYNVSPVAESAKLLTAVITPSYAVIRDVDWSVSFVNPDSDWAKGKNVTDYITIAPTKDGALTATVSCYQAFGEQIQVKVALRNNPAVYATQVLDYASRPTSWQVMGYYGDTFNTVIDDGATVNEWVYDYNFNDVNDNPNWMFSKPAFWMPYTTGDENTLGGVDVYYHSTFTFESSTMSEWAMNAHDGDYEIDMLSVTYNQEFIDDLKAAGLACTDIVGGKKYEYSRSVGATGALLSLYNELYSELIVRNDEQHVFTDLYYNECTADARRAWLEVMIDWSQKDEYAAIYEVKFSSEHIEKTAKIALCPTTESLTIQVESLALEDTDVVF